MAGDVAHLLTMMLPLVIGHWVTGPLCCRQRRGKSYRVRFAGTFVIAR